MKKNDNDTMILNLKKQVEDKKKLLKNNERFSPKTNCSLLLDNDRHNLNVIDKSTILLLLAKLQSLREGLNTLLPDEKLVISGYDVDLWIDDLKSRFNTLNRKLEEERLVVLEQKLHSLLTSDTKVELEIEDLKGQI